jgi:transposase
LEWTRRPKTAQALALRARIVLLCAEGRSNTEVARRVQVTLATVGKWRQRFLLLRLDGLLDEPRVVRQNVARYIINEEISFPSA